MPWRRKSQDVVLACKASAERLGVESIDLYQIHWPDIIQPLKAFGIEEKKDELYWDGISECYHQGLIKNVGVSNYGVRMLEQAHEALSARGVPIASNQINYSLLYLLVTTATLQHRLSTALQCKKGIIADKSPARSYAASKRRRATFSCDPSKSK